MSKTMEQHMADKTDRRGPDECWPWIGSLDARGRAKIQVRREGKSVSVLALRAAYELCHGGPVDPDLMVWHTCDQKLCMNPAHLRLRPSPTVSQGGAPPGSKEAGVLVPHKHRDFGVTDPFRPDNRGDAPEFQAVVRGILNDPALVVELVRRLAWTERAMLRSALDDAARRYTTLLRQGMAAYLKLYRGRKWSG